MNKKKKKKRQDTQYNPVMNEWQGFAVRKTYVNIMSVMPSIWKLLSSSKWINGGVQIKGVGDGGVWKMFPDAAITNFYYPKNFTLHYTDFQC